jgi:hypothetical protein
MHYQGWWCNCCCLAPYLALLTRLISIHTQEEEGLCYKRVLALRLCLSTLT